MAAVVTGGPSDRGGPGGPRFWGRSATRLTSGAVRTVGRTLVGAGLDLGNGALRGVEAVRDLVGGDSAGPSTLRVEVVILSDENGRPLCRAEDVQPALTAADTVLSDAAGIRVRNLGIRVAAEPAPAVALNPRADRALLLDDMLGRTAFYTRQAPRRPDPVGAPLTVVVVREIAGRSTGCSLGISADWVIVQASLFHRANIHTYDETVLVHELGHALNLPHHRHHANLMYHASSPPDQLRGTELSPWQLALLQANRHVVPGTRAARRSRPGPSTP